MRTRACAVLAAALALLVSGCGGGRADSGAVGPAPGGAPAAGQAVYDQIAALPKDQQRAKAVELAKQEGTLSLYTSMTEDLTGPVSKAFQAQFGIPVQVFRANSETVLQRTLQEGGANRLGGDAVETNFAEMESLAKEGLLADYNGAALDRVIPAGRFDHWTASRLNIFLPAWNTTLVKPGDEPRSWEDLADPKYRGKITVELSDNDWFANLTNYWLAHGKTQQQVDQLWQGIVANSKAAKGHTVMMQLLGAGQTPMDAMNYTYITEQAAQAGAPVAYRLADGTNPIPAFPRPNGVGLLAGAQHPAAAWLFYDWLLTEGQQVLVDQKITPSTEVPGDKSLDGLTIVPFDTETLINDGASWEKRYDELLRGVTQVSS
jgi:iron(III) transport system substrate-binding protein